MAPGLIQVSLVGKIGDGTPFFVGTSSNFTTVQSGILYLGFNDNYFGDNSGFFSATITTNFSCDLSITSLTVSSQTLDVTSGGSVGINGSISDSSGQAISWTIKVLDRTFTGSGALASATWDGKDASGNLVAAGTYTATLTAQTVDGQCTDSKIVNITVVKPACDLKVNSLTVSSQTLDVTSGGSVGINGSISDSSGQAISWTIKVLDRTFSGSGASASATWDGKDASGNLVAPGSYSVTLSAQTADGQCTDSKSTNITVIKPQEKDLDDCNNPCGCNETDTHSKVNLKSGNYYHSQNVISKPESLALDISYNSLESLDIPLGKGWNHSYNIRLIDATDSITLKLGGGDIRNFIRSGSSYLPEATSYDTTSIVKNSDNSYTRSFKNGLNQTFSNTGKLIAITDSNGNKSTLTYSGSDLATVTDPTGRTLTVTSSGGRISSIKDPAGRTTTFAYNGNLLTSVIDPSGNSWNYIYDANGKLTRKTNPTGFQSINDYDANGRNTSSTDSEGRTKTITYDNSTTSTVTEKDGSSWTRTFDPILNVPTATSDALGNIRSKTFDSKGNLLTSTKPDGNTTSYTYDTNGNMTSVTDPLGKSTS
ncbi:MAG: DUF6531 domain-containing protein, partial [Pedobacter sp.]